MNSDASRFVLGCVKARKHNGKFRLALGGPADDDEHAAQLWGNATTSALLDELRRDDLFSRFCAKDAGIPGKDYVIDIAGPACPPNDRGLAGMPGPVLRGIAIVLELGTATG